MSEFPTIYVALPIMDEELNIFNFLEALNNQTYKKYKLVACVNQPDIWWEDEEKAKICEANARVLKLLREEGYSVIDRTTRGNGWKGKDIGVGWARKTIMDYINDVAQSNDIIISVDADTVFGENYFSSIVGMFAKYSNRLALANPYYHKLTGDKVLDRAMLRYEIYMRCYSINLWLINSPYAFTALGSAIAFPVSTYKKIGGMTPKKSGEDFYFLQKICKAGRLITWNSETVFPATRYSDRVFFGTGPALIKGKNGDWSSYPIYHSSIFSEIKSTYRLFENLFYKNMATPMDTFIEKHFREANIWNPLRDNTKTQASFVLACHQKIDGLRILQFLKWKAAQLNIPDEDSLVDFMKHNFENFKINSELFSFAGSSIELLNDLRDFLFEKEKEFQLKDLFS